MLKWLPYPMLRASSAFALGIFMGLEREFNPAELEPLWIIIFVFYGLALKTFHPCHVVRSSALALTALTLFTLAGIMRSQTHQYQADPVVASADFFLAKVKVPTQQKRRHHVTTLALTRVWSKGKHYLSDDHIQWYQASRKPVQLPYGSLVVLKGVPSLIEPPQNPLEFNYAGFLAKKNIFWNHWTRENDIVAVFPNQKNSISSWSLQLRRHFQSLLATYLPAGFPQQVSMAMLLGDRQAVSDQLEDSFARSGTIHILAVSGLHMGILYWLVLQLIGSWRRHFLLKWFFVCLSLLLLWAFAIITGLAASTQRAATMFSVMILANAINKENNTINTLAISGLIILWVDPYELFSVGFQLSFLALSGILYLQPWIARWFNLNNKLLKYLWELVSVSLSAQLAVMPLSAYYFHQLPVYFLLANILLVPLSFAIVIIGILFFACSAITPLLPLVATPLNHLTQIAGYLVEMIAGFPGSSVQGLQLNHTSLFLWYGVLGSGIAFLRTHKRAAFLILVSLLCFVSLESVQRQIQNIKGQRIMVYQVPGHTAIDFINGRQYYTVIDSELALDTSTMDYKINNYRRYLDLQLTEHFLVRKQGNPLELWMFSGKRLLLIKAPFDKGLKKDFELKSNIVVVTGNSLDHIEQLKSVVDLDLLIIDGSNSKKNASRLERQALELGLEVHNCWEQGYKSINL